MPVTYDQLATTTLSSNQASVSFTSISSAYTDLFLVLSYRDTRTQTYSYPALRFNNDSGSNYSALSLGGSTNAISSTSANNQTWLNIGEGTGASSGTGQYSPIHIHIFNYANTTTNTTVLFRSQNVNSGAGGGNTVAGARQWRNTNAINRIDVIPDTGGGTNIASGTVITLFGIKAA